MKKILILLTLILLFCGTQAYANSDNEIVGDCFKDGCIVGGKVFIRVLPDGKSYVIGEISKNSETGQITLSPLSNTEVDK